MSKVRTLLLISNLVSMHHSIVLVRKVSDSTGSHELNGFLKEGICINAQSLSK
jgi:hypothetical protein